MLIRALGKAPCDLDNGPAAEQRALKVGSSETYRTANLKPFSRAVELPT